MRKQILLYFVAFFFTTSLLAQTCAVSVDELKGQYSGDCKKGKADGAGTATGIDSYTGNFKNGYPDGKGRYTWKSGGWYDGFWKNGLYDGQGTLNKTDSTKPGGAEVITGFWKKGKYVGSYEKPYVVRSTTNNINDLNIRKLNNTTSEIILVVKNVTAGASSIGYPVLPKSKLINVEAVNGRFQLEVPDESSSTVSNKYTFREITYPFYAIFSFETTGTNAKLHVEKVGVEFFENCNWYVQVGIDN